MTLDARSASATTEAQIDSLTTCSPVIATAETRKGPTSVRYWDNQLRQPILLHTTRAVIARPPLQGFLHEHDIRDTLGTDQPQTACRF